MKRTSTQMQKEAVQNNNINQSIPDELSTLLQIDLLLGHKNEFQTRLKKAFNELNEISKDSKINVKH